MKNFQILNCRFLNWVWLLKTLYGPAGHRWIFAWIFTVQSINLLYYWPESWTLATIVLSLDIPSPVPAQIFSVQLWICPFLALLPPCGPYIYLGHCGHPEPSICCVWTARHGRERSPRALGSASPTLLPSLALAGICNPSSGLCPASGWLSSCLPPQALISILVGGDWGHFASCEQNCFPSSRQTEACGYQQWVLFSPSTLRKGALAPAQVTHGALAQWRGRWFTALGGKGEQRGAFLTFIRAEAEAVI